MSGSFMWQFLAGLGFFLYGMSQLEAVLKKSSGRRLKLFLKQNTKSLFKSITGGALITGIVQSSSVVTLIILAFVETGIITFRNALGVILGTNVGTTLSSWIVATVGFRFDILSYSLPVIAVAATVMFFFEKRKQLYNLFSVFFALGVLFLGLGFMKAGASHLVERFDLTSYAEYGTFVFVLIGFIVTTVIQSSSATVAITLTALYTGALNFPSAAAVVIGSETGTTIKILLWGMKGSSDKKRVAIGNFYYNIFTSIIAYIFLHWIIYAIENFIQIQDPLIGLVFFQTSVNVLSVLLFIPFLNIFSKWLERSFKTSDVQQYSYISRDLPTIPALATDALKKEALNLIKKTAEFNKNIIYYERSHAEGLFENIKRFTHSSISHTEAYNRLKHTEGDLLNYYSTIQENALKKEDVELMLRYVNAVRLAVFAAKAIKDIAHDLNDFSSSANNFIHSQLNLFHEEWSDFDATLHKIFLLGDDIKIKTQMDTTLSDLHSLEHGHKSEILLHLRKNEIKESEASTLLNVHNELFSSKISLMNALINTISNASEEKN